MFASIGQWSAQVSNEFSALYPLSLLEGLNSPCDNNASAAHWKRKPISDDYFPRMDKAVLSISGNVYKQQEMVSRLVL
jgi:hypothetical protein